VFEKRKKRNEVHNILYDDVGFRRGVAGYGRPPKPKDPKTQNPSGLID
jgi:hypothetical protein